MASPAAAAAVVSVSDGYLLSRFGLGADASLFRLGALSVIFLEEVVRLYAPLVFKGLSFVLLCIPLPNLFGAEQAGEGDTDASSSESTADAPTVPEEYATFVDDRKASRGDDNDVYMLQTHGFDKFRHTSEAFLLRNKLASGTSSDVAEDEGDEAAAGGEARGGKKKLPTLRRGRSKTRGKGSRNAAL